MDGVMAGTADHQGLAPHPRHECRPFGPAGAGLAEVRETADLMNTHCRAFITEFAAPAEEPGDQLLAWVGDCSWPAVVEDRVLVPCEGYPVEPGDQRLLAFAFVVMADTRPAEGVASV
jgi:hypothetical protein